MANSRRFPRFSTHRTGAQRTRTGCVDRPPPSTPDAYGITKRDYDRLESFLRIGAEGAESGARLAGGVGVATTLTLGSLLLSAAPGFDTSARVMTQVMVPLMGVIFLGSFGAMPFLPSLERLYLDEYLAMPHATDTERAKAVHAMELKWFARSNFTRTASTLVGIGLAGCGALIAFLALAGSAPVATVVFGVVAGLSTALGGLVFGFGFEPPFTNLFRQYALSVDRETGGRPMAGVSGEVTDAIVDREKRRTGGTF